MLLSLTVKKNQHSPFGRNRKRQQNLAQNDKIDSCIWDTFEASCFDTTQLFVSEVTVFEAEGAGGWSPTLFDFKACLNKFKCGFFNGGSSVLVGQCIVPISGEDIDRVPDAVVVVTLIILLG